jgi:diguanylate cyclase (GGDEF)-like protein
VHELQSAIGQGGTMQQRPTSSLPASPAASQDTLLVEFANQLMAADDAAGVAEAVVAAARSQSGCREATLLWSLNWPGRRNGFPSLALSSERLALADRAVDAADGRAESASGGDLALVLHRAEEGAAAVLVCRLEKDAVAVDVDPFWQRLMALAGARIAAVLEVARLHDSVSRLEQAERLQRALFAIADMAGSELEMSEMLPQLHRIVGGLMYAENFYIALYDRSKDALRFIYFVDTADPDAVSPGQVVPMAEIERGLTWYLIRDGRPLMGPTHALRQQVTGALRIHGPDSPDWLGVPMLRGSEVRGALVVQSYVEHVNFTPSDQALLSFVGNHILTALERKQGQEELEHRVDQRTEELAEAIRGLNVEVEERQRGERLQAVLFRIAELSSGDGSMDEFYGGIHGIVGSLINARNFYIALLSDDGSELAFPYHVDEVESSPVTRPLGNGVTEFLLRTGKPLLASAADLNRLQDAGAFQFSGTVSESWLGVPLLAGERVMGAVVVQSYSPEVRYGWREQELLTFVSYQIASSLQRRHATQALREANASLEQRVAERTRELREQIAVREKIELQLKHEVMHDALTDLPNRGYLRDRLERVLARARRSGHPAFAVLYCDVDRFKVINDSLGHLAGDEVLKEVGRRLSACVREPDVVARLGGDEFAVLIEETSGPETPMRIAQRIIESISLPMQACGKEILTSTSIGVAMGDRRHRHADDVLRDADVAMYRAKKGGRHRFEIFDESLNQRALDVLELEAELRQALSRHEFLPHFQPIVRLADGAVVGHEALLRWQHPTRGLLAPGDFIRTAEENGSIEAIDWLLFEHACGQARERAELGYITLNVSPRHFARPGLDERLLAMIRRCEITPERVRIELTEGTLLDKPEQTVITLEKLRVAGVLAAIDDFGTGFSSLSYIHRFPLQMLKIDRSFVSELGTPRDGGSRAVIRAILTLAQALAMEVVAEGIETETQRSALLDLGCDHGQGFLLGRPQAI